MTPEKKLYPHRHNKDGSHDSICPVCFQTVASLPFEAGLSQCELDHICIPGTINNRIQHLGAAAARQQLRRATPAPRPAPPRL